MAKQWFDSEPPRSRRTVFTVMGSLVLHGTLIAVAALWPVRRVDTAPAKEPPATQFVDVTTPVESSELPTAETDPGLTPPAEPPPPMADVSLDAPPSEEPELTDPTPPKLVTKSVVAKTRSPRTPSAVGVHGGPPARPGAASGATGATGVESAAGRWNTPQPPYPYPLRAAHVQGSGSVRITTDASGRVVSASVVQSTGNTLMDDNTSRFARAFWSGPPNASVTVPITYRMR